MAFTQYPLFLLCAALLLLPTGCTIPEGWLGDAVSPADLPSTSSTRRSPTSVLDGAWYYHVGDMTKPPATLPDRKTLGVMRVPSNWYKEGLDVAGVVWFFREVDLDQNPNPIDVRFDAVDYAADVYWDGSRIGQHRGYFAPFHAVVPPRQRAGRHLLAVRVDSPLEKPEAWSLHKTLIKGVLSHHDTRPGGAWSDQGQDANTGGIWGHVTMRRIVHGMIDDVRVTTVTLTPGRAQLTLSAQVSHVRDLNARLNYRIVAPGGNVAAEGTLGDVQKDGRFSADIVIDHPELWWPYELGAPKLYRVWLLLDGENGTDVASASFGIRTVSRDDRNRIIINDVPFFLRGTNYIGSLYYASMTEEALRRDLELMKTAHINAIRVHAHIASPTFYRLCNELGLLVWQDFPLQWGYDDSPSFALEAKRQLREMIATLYNNPSIIHWTGINEAPWSSDWMIWKYPDYNPDQNRLLERTLRETLLLADPSRPSQGNSHPAEHAWSGWYSGTYLDFAKPTPLAIITEFGAQAVPAVATLKTFLDERTWWPLEGKTLAMWEYHNFQLRELQQIAHVPLGQSVAELVDNTQEYQARLTQFAAENLRRQKWQPVTAIFQFMFVEHWPSINWGVVDYLRKPKLGYEALAGAYRPLLPIVATKPGTNELVAYILNDTQKQFPDAMLIVRTSDDSQQAPVFVRPGNVTPVHTPLAAPRVDQDLMLELRDADDNLLSVNRYQPGYFAVEARP